MLWSPIPKKRWNNKSETDREKETDADQRCMRNGTGCDPVAVTCNLEIQLRFGR